MDLGTSWEKVSERVGRMSGDCRDRWRNHLYKKEGRVFGKSLMTRMESSFNSLIRILVSGRREEVDRNRHRDAGCPGWNRLGDLLDLGCRKDG